MPIQQVLLPEEQERSRTVRIGNHIEEQRNLDRHHHDAQPKNQLASPLDPVRKQMKTEIDEKALDDQLVDRKKHGDPVQHDRLPEQQGADDADEIERIEHVEMDRIVVAFHRFVEHNHR